MYPPKNKEKSDFYFGSNGYIFKAISIVLILVFALNLYNFGLSKAGFVFADEENSTTTLESIISTQTVNELTSDENIATTSIISESIGDIFSEIILSTEIKKEQATLTEEVSTSTNLESLVNEENSSTTEDAIETEISTTTNDALISTSTILENSISNIETKVQKEKLNEYSETTFVTKVISPIIVGSFKSGVIPVIVSFNKKVYVEGKPQLVLSTGNPEFTNIDYKSGSGSTFLFFLYSIKKGNYSTDLDYANSNSLLLNGGSIKDENGNDIDLTLPNPGSAESLSGLGDIVIKN